MLNEVYNKILNDDTILNIYKEIELVENKEKGWAYHNFAHVLNVLKITENILLLMNYSKNFILKAKIACLLHDVGALQGKDNHAYRSYEYAKNYFKTNNIIFKGLEDVLEAIKIHSDGFDTDNLIALTLILADKLDIKSNRITSYGGKVIGNRQYTHIKDIIINIYNGCLTIHFISDGKIDMKELNDYYFTKKVFKAIESFSNKVGLKYKVLIDNTTWDII